MREYIKKFSTVNSSDNYSIIDIPFITTIVGASGARINLVCNQEGKKLSVSDGQVVVEDNVNLLSLIIEESPEDIVIQYEQGMTWNAFINSKYNDGNICLSGFDAEIDDVMYVCLNKTNTFPGGSIKPMICKRWYGSQIGDDTIDNTGECYVYYGGGSND